jgi:hypothetical protein
MDLNVKSWGLKYNFDIVQGVKCKNTRIQIFLEFLKYFSIEKLVNRAYGPVDQVHGIRSMGLHSEMIPAVELVIDDRDLIS